MLVYFDHANWIDLADGRVPTEALERKASAGELIIVASAMYHAVETSGIGMLASREAVVRLVERFVAMQAIRWVVSAADLLRLEATAEFIRWLGYGWAPPPALKNTLRDALAEHEVARALLGQLPIAPDFRMLVDTWVESRNRPENEARIAAVVQTIRRNKPTTRRSRRIDNRAMRGVVAASVPSEVQLTGSGLLIPVSDSQRVAFEKEVNLDHCPYNAVVTCYHTAVNMQPDGLKHNDIADTYHLAGAVYSDIAFVDKRTAALLRQGQAPWSGYRRNAEFDAWVADL